jgi:hypothetical protein
MSELPAMAGAPVVTAPIPQATSLVWLVALLAATYTGRGST